LSNKKKNWPQEEGDPELEAMGREMLKEILGSQTFSLKEADLSKIRTIEQLRRTALKFEKDTIVFYEMIRSFLTDRETVDQLDAIIEEENRHVKLFEEYQGREAGISIERMNGEKEQG
jgi:rubrerythrin